MTDDGAKYLADAISEGFADLADSVRGLSAAVRDVLGSGPNGLAGEATITDCQAEIGNQLATLNDILSRPE